MATKITASALDRELSDILNRVAYRGESFLIERGGKVLARLEPAGPMRGMTLRELVEKLGNLQVPEGLADELEASRAARLPLETPEWPE